MRRHLLFALLGGLALRATDATAAARPAAPAAAAESGMPRPGGLLRVPTDQVLPHRGLALTGGGYYDPAGSAAPGTAESALSLREGFFDRMEIGLSGIGTRPGAGLGGLAVRVRLLREQGPIPALTAGGVDLAGERRGIGPSARVEWRDWRRHLDRLGVYAVAGEDLGTRARVVVGVGDSHYLGRLGVGHAGAGAFGGVEVTLRRSASAVAEYDGAHANAGLRLSFASPPLGGSVLAIRALVGGGNLLDRAPQKPLLAFRIDIDLQPVAIVPGTPVPAAPVRAKKRVRRPAAAAPRPPKPVAAPVEPVVTAAPVATESSRVQVQIDTVQSHLDLIRGSGFAPLVDDLLKGATDNVRTARERLTAGDLDGARRAADFGGEQVRLARQKIEEETQQPMRW